MIFLNLTSTPCSVGFIICPPSSWEMTSSLGAALDLDLSLYCSTVPKGWVWLLPQLWCLEIPEKSCVSHGQGWGPPKAQPHPPVIWCTVGDAVVQPAWWATTASVLWEELCLSPELCMALFVCSGLLLGGCSSHQGPYWATNPQPLRACSFWNEALVPFCSASKLIYPSDWFHSDHLEGSKWDTFSKIGQRCNSYGEIKSASLGEIVVAFLGKGGNSGGMPSTLQPENWVKCDCIPS